MSPVLLKKLAQFRIQYKRTTGIAADLSQLVMNPEYGMTMLTNAEDTDDMEMLCLVLELKAELGYLVKPEVVLPETVIALTQEFKIIHEEVKEPETQSNYKFGARGG